MREIKFRGYNETFGWRYGDYKFTRLDEMPEIYHDGYPYVVDIDSIGQFTGLHDKNGKEIYEGDIVKGSNSRVAYVTFLQQEMGYVLVYHNNDTRLLGHRNTGSSYDIDFNIEVIGNIYENPELLKE